MLSSISKAAPRKGNKSPKQRPSASQSGSDVHESAEGRDVETTPPSFDPPHANSPSHTTRISRRSHSAKNSSARKVSLKSFPVHQRKSILWMLAIVAEEMTPRAVPAL